MIFKFMMPWILRNSVCQINSPYTCGRTVHDVWKIEIPKMIVVSTASFIIHTDIHVEPLKQEPKYILEAPNFEILFKEFSYIK